MTNRMTSHAPQALGTLQDAGELAVMTPNEGPVRHRYAMVVAFESEDELRRALEEHRCSYRDGQAVEEMTHG
ncbi:hypothetical protein SAMN05421509_10734 [Chromohalobacter canadensis]|uniref:Uncharacterized protein n=1 Tax=Chromohalobacter canadensis TaxID=141389 RepID=A0A285VQW2_9GAMM|nr:hypothetical protein [Chromohalobacter canadensis]SOC56425.1 hypothetical protein SAMN05421509_10734 [Chromohalobacter canadensis]